MTELLEYALLLYMRGSRLSNVWSYSSSILRNSIRPGSLALEIVGLALGLTGLLLNVASRSLLIVYFAGLLAFLLIWNTYAVGLLLHSQVSRAHRIELLLKSRAKLRAHEKRREIYINAIGVKDVIETTFLVEAVSLPVKTFYVRLQTDHQDHVIDRQRDWDIEEGRAVRTDMYKIGRKYAEFIVEHSLFRAIFKGDPREIHVVHRADLVDPIKDWVGIDIIEETGLALLRAWFPPGVRPLPDTIERFKMKGADEIPMKGRPQRVSLDEASQRWFIEDTFSNCELFVSYCLRWEAVEESLEDPPSPAILSQLAPRTDRTEACTDV